MKLKIKQNKAALIPGAVILLIIILSVLAPLLTGYDETVQDLLHRLAPPGNGHIFGTDELGRDVFTRILKQSLQIVPQMNSV